MSDASRVSLRAFEFTRNIFGVRYSSSSLDFDMELQTEDNWCWAATATSVSHFYRPASTWTQCLVANGELGRGDCCNGPAPSACDVPWYLDRAMTRTKNFERISGPISFAAIRTEIDAGRPVGARSAWAGGGAHFMVIYGYSTAGGVEYLEIDDPIYGKSKPSFASFSTAYQGSGAWTHAYFTKREPLVIRFKPTELPERLRRRIWEARPLVDLRSDVAEDSLRSGRSLTLPHFVFTVTLEEAARMDRLPERPVALRVIEAEGIRGAAFYDVDPREDGAVQQVAGDATYSELLNRAIKVAQPMLEEHEAAAELRLLRVPALYLDAVWLHFEHGEGDVLVPIRSRFGVQSFRAYSASDFINQVAERAQTRMPEADDTIAP